MRPTVTAILAAGLLVGTLLAGAASAEQCARPADKTAFDVAGLKSQLMVTALACQAEEKYNTFVTRFRADLQAHERALSGYFSRAYGRSAQRQHDDYITSLANAQSESGIKGGTLFCQQNLAMFDEVLALKDGTALPSYAAGKALTQPIVLTDCPMAVDKSTRTAKR
jgi:hypothetical protein